MIAYSGNKILTFYQEAKECFGKEICIPRMALIYPTRACNQNCYFCSDKETNVDLHKRMMDPRLLISLPKQLKDLGCESVELCGGGEPFLHKELPAFINECARHDLKLGSLTNGTMLKDELADLVIKTFSYVRISIDSFNPTTYATVRGTPLSGPSSLEQVKDNIKYLVKKKKETDSRMLITIKAVFDKLTIHELDEYIEIGSSLNVDGINIKATMNVPNELEGTEIDFINKLNKYKQENELKARPWIFGSLGKTILETPNCFACNFHVFIDTDSSLRLCCYYQNRPEEHTYGMVTTTNLKELWYSQLHKNTVKSIDVSKCNLYNCKYHAYNKVLFDGIAKDLGQWQFT